MADPLTNLEPVSDDRLRIENYDYKLPKELIAQEPLPVRSDARLMLVDRATNQVSHHHVRDLPELLNPGDLLILNDTRVIPAKLIGYRKSTRGRWQGLFLQADEHGVWKVLAKTRGNIQPGETVVLQDRNGADRLEIVMLARLDEGAWAIRPVVEAPVEQLLQQVGRVPLPHYIRDGNMVDADLANYQTVFANKPGAVAAPTAGLHLTERLLQRLHDIEIQTEFVTLHVGTGTFRPIKVDDVSQHPMHSELGILTAKTAAKIRETKADGGRVIAVGTTSVRILETVAQQGEIKTWTGATDIYIYPGHKFKIVDGLMTNFHLPRTSLLVLARTFGGDKLIRQAYAEAVENEYRFFSYGDAMLIL